MSKIVIVSFTFPPAYGIGARRWSKFSKYFSKKKHEVAVIAAASSDKGVSPWEKDISEIKDKAIYLSSGYPKQLSIQPKKLWEKILYRLSLLYVKVFIKENYYDRAALWKKQLTTQIENKINEGYNNVIVSVGPFHSAYHISEIIPKYPEVNFIVDFRDPWVNNKTSFGFESLSKRRLQFEKTAEEKVIRSFTKIVSVSQQMNKYFIETYKMNSAKFHTITNGYDPDEISINESLKPDTGSFLFAFTGTFYPKAKYILKLLNKELDTLKIKDPKLYALIRFEFMGECTFDTSFLTTNHSNIVFSTNQKQQSVFDLIQRANFCTLFLTDDINYSFSTKFCEYIAYKKPIVVFSQGGTTGKFVEDHKIGFHVDVNNFTERFQTLLDKMSNHELTFDTAFNNDTFNIIELTKNYEKLLI